MVEGLCKFGCKVDESIHHLFFSCDLVRAAWFECFFVRLPCHLSTKDILSCLRKFLLDNSDNAPLVKGIIALVNDIWMKRNQVVHGGKVPQPHDIIRDSQVTLSFSTLAFSTKLKPQFPDNKQLSFSLNLSPWNLCKRKWKLNRSSFCRILICYHMHPLQSFTWKRHHMSGVIFSLACFRMTLKWIHCSNLPLDKITIWNVSKRLIDFSG